MGGTYEEAGKKGVVLPTGEEVNSGGPTGVARGRVGGLNGRGGGFTEGRRRVDVPRLLLS